MLDISNEHRAFSMQCGLMSILIVWVFISSLPPLFSGTFPFGGFIPLDRLVKASFFPLSLWCSSFCLLASIILPFAGHWELCALLRFSSMVPLPVLWIFYLWSLKYSPQSQSGCYVFLCWEKENQCSLLAVGHPTFFQTPIPIPSPNSYSLKSSTLLALLPKSSDIFF